MALDHAALLEVLEAMKAAEVVPRHRHWAGSRDDQLPTTAHYSSAEAASLGAPSTCNSCRHSRTRRCPHENRDGAVAERSPRT